MPAVIVSPARVGFAFGFITAFSNLGNLIGPAAAGALRDQVEGWVLVWAVLAGAAFIGAMAALRLPITGNRAPAPSE
jgi:MFS family permease